MEIVLIFCWDGSWKFRKNYSPTKLGRDIGIAVADLGGVTMKPVISWEVPYNQLVEGRKSELGLWMGRPVYCYK